MRVRSACAPSFSRRATLQAAAGVTASALVTAGFIQTPTAAQVATPAAPSDLK